MYNITGIEKCKRWVNACRREGFNLSNVTKDTYICSLHFVGNKGPTVDHPDPIPATATDRQVGVPAFICTYTLVKVIPQLNIFN